MTATCSLLSYLLAYLLTYLVTYFYSKTNKMHHCIRFIWTPDDGRKDRPKHVECHSKTK